VWQWTSPLRALRKRRRRFASASFLAAGVAFGTAVYLVVAHAERTFQPARFPFFAGLVALMVALVWLGASAENEVQRIDEEIAEIEAEAVRLLDQAAAGRRKAG
jgi:hypothetical protein